MRVNELVKSELDEIKIHAEGQSTNYFFHVPRSNSSEQKWNEN